jgi:BirA family transcriptional regulator, biotin operon repressor / biotin---[acetyl-CoA-carboxylase] ligase
MSVAADRRDRVLAALTRAAPDHVSGEALAGALGCSRAAVHRHVAALRRAGVAIHGEAGGYRLDAEEDPVSATLVQERLVPPVGGPVTWLAEVGSTNDEAAARARAGAPEGTVVGADHQTVGRGRRGRPWADRPGASLCVSVVLRPGRAPVEAGLIPLLAAVAVAEAVGPEARIVWPNDVVVGDRKVAGILCETSTDHERIAWTVVGMGVNVHALPDVPDARWSPGRVADVRPGVRRADLLVDLLGALGRLYAVWCRDGGSPELVRAFGARDVLEGRMVTLRMGDDEVRGVGEGIDGLGRLRVRPVGSATSALLAMGEVTRVSAITADA